MTDFEPNTSIYVKVAPPFTKLIGNNIVKVMIGSVANINNIRTYDPLVVIYKTNGLSEADYQVALANDILILELIDCKGTTYLIPETSLQVYNEDDITPYAMKTISIAIGIHPNDKDFSDLEDELRDLIKARLGVDPAIDIINTSNVLGLTNDIIDAINEQRTAVINSSNTGQLEQAIQDKALAEAKVNKLSEYIANCDCNCG